MKELFESIGKRVDAKNTNYLQKIGDELTNLSIIGKNFDKTPGARVTLRKMHITKLFMRLIELCKDYEINYTELVDNVKKEHQNNIANDYLKSEKEDTGGMFKIICERDISNDGPKPNELGYYFLFSTKRMPKDFTINNFKSLIEKNTNLKWNAKEQCICGRYIFTTTYNWSSFSKVNTQTIQFFLDLPYTPESNKFITKLEDYYGKEQTV